jgi:hypothetical protein
VSTPGAAPAEAAAAPPAVLSAPTLTGRAVVGGRLSLSGGLYSGGALQSAQFYRCGQQCTPLGAPGAGTYTLTTADEGQYIRAQARVAGAGGVVTVWTANLLGPVTGPTAGAAGLSVRTSAAGDAAVRAAGHTLVTVRSRRAARRIKLSLTAPSRAVTVRVYVLRAGAIVSCTPARVVRGRLQLAVTLAAGDRVQVAAVVPARRT